MVEQFESAQKTHEMHTQIREGTGRKQSVGVTTCIVGKYNDKRGE